MQPRIGLTICLFLAQLSCAHSLPTPNANALSLADEGSGAKGAKKLWSCLAQISSYSTGEAVAGEWHQSAPFTESHPYNFALVFVQNANTSPKIFLEDMRAKVYELSYDKQSNRAQCSANVDNDDEDFFCFTFALPIASNPVVSIEVVHAANQFKMTRIEAADKLTSKHSLITASKQDASLIAKDVGSRLDNMKDVFSGIISEVPQDLANDMEEDIKKLDPECREAISEYSRQFVKNSGN